MGMPEAAFTCLVTSCWRMPWIDDTGVDVLAGARARRVALSGPAGASGRAVG
jgi:hypothetical protein